MFRFLKRLFGKSQTINRSGLIDSAGMEVVASKAPAKTEMPVSTDTIEIVRPSEEIAMFECGHTGPQTFGLDIYGAKTGIIRNSSVCSECLLQEVKDAFIRCVRCGSVIMPRDCVAAYHEDSPGLRKDIGYRVGNNFLGCMSKDCCPSGRYEAGFWTGEAFQPMFKDGATAGEQVMATGKPVYIEDTKRR